MSYPIKPTPNSSYVSNYTLNVQGHSNEPFLNLIMVKASTYAPNYVPTFHSFPPNYPFVNLNFQTFQIIPLNHFTNPTMLTKQPPLSQTTHLNIKPPSMKPFNIQITLVKYQTSIPTTHSNSIYFHQMIKLTFPQKGKSSVMK